MSSIDPNGLIDLEIPGATGELAMHGNPGREVIVDPKAMAEHPPAHVHMGNREGPRIRLTDFEPFSDDDAKLLTKKQRDFCKALSNKERNLVRQRAKNVYRFGSITAPSVRSSVLRSLSPAATIIHLLTLEGCARGTIEQCMCAIESEQLGEDTGQCMKQCPSCIEG